MQALTDATNGWLGWFAVWIHWVRLPIYFFVSRTRSSKQSLKKPWATLQVGILTPVLCALSPAGSTPSYFWVLSL